jgi:AraC-like DNA-binding protein
MIGYNDILKSINLEAIATSSDIDSNSINRNYKLRQAAIFNALREANPHLNAKELAQQMGTSTSTLQRIRKDINMKSPYHYDISSPKRKNHEVQRAHKNESELTQRSENITASDTKRLLSKVLPPQSEPNKKSTSTRNNKRLSNPVAGNGLGDEVKVCANETIVDGNYIDNLVKGSFS